MRYSLIATICLAVASTSGSATASGTDGLAQELSGLLQVQAAAAPVPGAMLRVDMPAAGFTFSQAVGRSDVTSGAALRPEQTLRVASNTKTYIAAAILRLAEDDRLDLDAPIGRYLRPESLATLERGGYQPSRMTPRMLLQHTSGLFDFAASASYLDRVVSDPAHRWTRAEQLQLAMTDGEGYGEPGEVYHYSDTGYILLGEMLEVVTGRPMSRAVRELIGFDRLGIRTTWFESLDPVPAGAPPRTHQYMEGMDTEDIDASSDLFGGGGLVSNLEDMARFYRALLQGQVFRRPATLDVMRVMSLQSLESGEGGYGMGLGEITIDGVACYGHEGFWGTLAWHCPAVDVTVVGAMTDTLGRDALRGLTRGALQRAIAAVAPARPDR